MTNSGGNVGAHYGEALRHMLKYLYLHDNLPSSLSQHSVFRKNDIQIQDVRLTENFACYDFVRMVNVNNRFHELSGKHISASDGTNNALIGDILMDIQQIYWRYKFKMHCICYGKNVNNRRKNKPQYLTPFQWASRWETTKKPNDSFW